MIASIGSRRSTYETGRRVEPKSATRDSGSSTERQSGRQSATALVPLPRVAQEHTENFRSEAHAHAPFLTHLIATYHDLPQTRVHRRADANQTLDRYRETDAINGYLPRGMIIQRSI